MVLQTNQNLIWGLSPDSIKKGDIIIAEHKFDKFNRIIKGKSIAVSSNNINAEPVTVTSNPKYFGGYYSIKTNEGDIIHRRDLLICKLETE